MPPPFWKKQEASSIPTEPPVLPPLDTEENVSFAEITAAVDQVLARDAREREQDERLHSRGVELLSENSFLYNGRLYRSKSSDKKMWECVTVDEAGEPVLFPSVAAQSIPGPSRTPATASANEQPAVVSTSADKKGLHKFCSWFGDSDKELKKNLKKRNITVLQDTLEGISGGMLDQEVALIPTSSHHRHRSAEFARGPGGTLDVPHRGLLCTSAPPREGGPPPFVPYFAAMKPSRPTLRTPNLPGPRSASNSDVRSTAPPTEFPPENLCVLRMNLLRNEFALEPRQGIDPIFIDLYFPGGGSLQVPIEVVTTLYPNLYGAQLEPEWASNSDAIHRIGQVIHMDTRERVVVEAVTTDTTRTSTTISATAEAPGIYSTTKARTIKEVAKHTWTVENRGAVNFGGQEENIPPQTREEKVEVDEKIKSQPCRKKGYLDSIFHGTTSAQLPVFRGAQDPHSVAESSYADTFFRHIANANQECGGSSENLLDQMARKQAARASSAERDDGEFRDGFTKKSQGILTEPEIDSRGGWSSPEIDDSGSVYSRESVVEERHPRYEDRRGPLRVISQTTPDREQLYDEKNNEYFSAHQPYGSGFSLQSAGRVLPKQVNAQVGFLERGRQHTPPALQQPSRRLLPVPKFSPPQSRRSSRQMRSSSRLYDYAQMENKDCSQKVAQQEMNYIKYGGSVDDFARQFPAIHRMPASGSFQDRFLSNRLRVDDVLKNSGDNRYPGSPSSINQRTNEGRGRQEHKDMPRAEDSRQGSYPVRSRSRSSSAYSDSDEGNHCANDKQPEHWCHAHQRGPDWTSSKETNHSNDGHDQYASENDEPSHFATGTPTPPAPARFEYFQVSKNDRPWASELNMSGQSNENLRQPVVDMPGYRKGNYRPPIPAPWNHLNPVYDLNEPKEYDYTKPSGYYGADHPIHEEVNMGPDSPSTSSPSSSGSFYATHIHAHAAHQEKLGHETAVPFNHHIISTPTGATPIPSRRGAIIHNHPPQMSNAPHCPARPAPAPPKYFFSSLTRSKNKKQEERLRLPVRQPPAHMSEAAQAA
ncbi:hypothetical protein TWF694_005299 [Orbilia ellipsospora]|uniref:Uncharacterized protein n=1 Tax=Orbilia ellipsospora TaxID=2528407 RepID=A0AAV9WT14_9PEZI